MRRIICAGAAALALALAVGGAEAKVFADPDFAGNFHALYKDPVGWRTAPKDALELTNGEVVSTCEEFLERAKRDLIPESRNTHRIYRDYLPCHVLSALERANPSVDYKPASYAEELYHRLDLRSFGNCFKYMLAKETEHTFSDLHDPSVRQENRFVVLRADQRSYYSLSVVSDADLNGNRKPDWQLLMVDIELDGTLFISDAFVIWDVGPTGLLRPARYGE